MRLKIDLEIPNWTKWLVGGIAIGLVLGAGAVVLADAVSVPNSFKDGDTLSAEQINANFKTLQDAINALKNPDCPEGYARDTSVSTFVLCNKGVDEMVKVGSGGSAFWIDRYEASVWNSFAATDPPKPYGSGGLADGASPVDDYPNSFPDTGQWTVPLFAVSKAGVYPSRALTWFQANEACRASGKRLPDVGEWFAAGRGTPSGTSCNIGAGTQIVPWKTGQGLTCASGWGAQDMVGNFSELTGEWYAATAITTPNFGLEPWPATGVSGDYGGAGMWNISSYADDGVHGPVKGLPAVFLRGGGKGLEGAISLFTVNAEVAPSYWGGEIAFRCVVLR